MQKFLLVLFVPFVLFGCSNDDDVVSEPVVGSWELVSIENEVVHNSPDDEQILITFEETEYVGKTEANEFGGDYNLSGNKLFLTNSYTTEAADTEWGLLFYEALRGAYSKDHERSEFSYSLQEENLTLRSNEGAMIFNRLEL